MKITVCSNAFLLGVLGFCYLAQGYELPDVIEQQCDPRVNHRFDACPGGYCCVRDEFLPSWVYCKRLGSPREGCTTRDSETNCPCSQGLVCQPNIVSSSGTASLYGKCELVTTTTTSTTTNAPSDSTTTSPETPATSVPTQSAASSETPAASVPTHSSVTPCPHGHSCEHHGHHATHAPHDNSHTHQQPIVG